MLGHFFFVSLLARCLGSCLFKVMRSLCSNPQLNEDCWWVGVWIGFSFVLSQNAYIYIYIYAHRFFSLGFRFLAMHWSSRVQSLPFVVWSIHIVVCLSIFFSKLFLLDLTLPLLLLPLSFFVLSSVFSRVLVLIHSQYYWVFFLLIFLMHIVYVISRV